MVVFDRNLRMIRNFTKRRFLAISFAVVSGIGVEIAAAWITSHVGYQCGFTALAWPWRPSLSLVFVIAALFVLASLVLKGRSN
jgi:hypothetical protein